MKQPVRETLTFTFNLPDPWRTIALIQTHFRLSTVCGGDDLNEEGGGAHSRGRPQEEQPDGPPLIICVLWTSMRPGGTQGGIINPTDGSPWPTTARGIATDAFHYADTSPHVHLSLLSLPSENSTDPRRGAFTVMVNVRYRFWFREWEKTKLHKLACPLKWSGTDYWTATDQV